MEGPKAWLVGVALILFCCAGHSMAQDAKPIFYSASGFVSASGKWKSTSGVPGDEIGHKHVVGIRCRLDIRECSAATAQTVGNEPQLFLEDYSVIQWDKNGIMAEDSSSICMTKRLIVNFQERSVIEVDSPKKGAKGMPLGNGRNACQLADHTVSYKLVASRPFSVVP